MAGQDYTKRLSAGGIQPVNISGDYIFCKFADRPFSVIVDGTRTTMEAGDKYRPGAFKTFEIENTDQDRAIAIVLNIGRGDYSRQIVQGNITVIPGIRKADGTFVDDTRWDLSAEVTITDPVPMTFEKAIKTEEFSIAGPQASSLLIQEKTGDVLIGRYGQFDLYNLKTQQVQSFGDTNARGLLLGGGAVYIKSFSGTNDDSGELWLMGGRGDLQGIGDPAIVRVGANLGVEDTITVPLAEAGRSYFTPKWINSAMPAMGAAVAGGRFLIFVAHSDRVWGIYEKISGEVRYTGKELTTPSQKQIHQFIPENGLIVGQWAAAGYPVIALDPDTLELVSTAGLTGYAGNVAISPARRIYVRQEPFNVWGIYNLFTWTRTGVGVFKTCGGGYMFKPSETITEAAIVSQQDGRGRVTLNGQLVRGMLELYLGKFVADDYLDHEGGQTPKTISAGNTTFSGAKIPDNFSAVFPQKITITIDNGLKAKG